LRLAAASPAGGNAAATILISLSNDQGCAVAAQISGPGSAAPTEARGHVAGARPAILATNN